MPSRPPCRTASSWSCTRAASPRGGGCSAPSEPAAVRPAVYHRAITTVFASTEELTREQALGAGVRSIPRPSLLAEPLEARGATAKGLAALGIETHGDLI